jgi:hypothetical protein
MSLYDELLCLYPLPDGWDPTGRVFQTKDTPTRYLDRYVLRADGTLAHESTGAVVAFHGALTFYTGNISYTGPDGYVTEDDQDAWWAEYVALYDHGTLLKLEGGKRPMRMAKPRLPRLPRTALR